MEKQPIITISREYCAGGRTIAKGLSDALGLPWYDRDFVKLTSRISGYSEEEVAQEGEEISETEHFFDSIANNIASFTSSHDAIYKAQKEAIFQLSEQPCIIVGRLSNIILREANIPSFDIYLYADKDIRIERAKARPECPKDSNIKKYVERRDDLRENYYKSYAHRNMNMVSDYSICLDTGEIDYDTCISVLTTVLKKYY